MGRSRSLLLVLIATAALTNSGVRSAPDPCTPHLERLDAQSRSGDVAGAARTLDLISGGSACSASRIDEAKASLSKALVRQAARLQDDPGRRAEYRALLQEAVRYGVSWEASWRLGDLQVRQKEFQEAARTYQQAVEILASVLVDVPAARRDAALVRIGNYLVQRSEEARHLAASANASAAFISAVPGQRGERFGGVYSDAFGRGIEASKVPPPITFLYNSTEFTSTGRQAADELLEVLRERRADAVTVTGHTDQKGTDAYNMDLSRRRAIAVIDFLRARGLAAAFTAVGKGRSEPRGLSSESDYSREEIDGLNRRVEIDWRS